MSTILLDRTQGIARITLNRPDAGNAITMILATELCDVAQTVSTDPTIRCVVLNGAGRLFCVGGDVGEMAAAGDDAPQFLRELADTLHRAIIALATMAKPLVVLINGPAAGAGLSLAMLGDVVLATRSAHFTAAYTGIGLTPDGGMSWLLPRLVGLRRAQAMILLNRRVGADEAERINLVTQVVDDGTLELESQHVIEGLLAAPTAAIGAARGLLLAGSIAPFQDHLDHEAKTIAAAGGHRESREGVAAFLERRKPDFHGA